MSTTPTDTPETDRLSKKCDSFEQFIAEFENMERRARAAEAALRLRPIAEAGPVPEGAVRLWAYWQDGFKRWNIKDIPVNGPTHCVDVFLPAEAQEGGQT